MALALGVAAMFFGVVFVIVGWKGGGTSAMNSNLAGMVKGQYPVGTNSTSNSTAPSTSTTGGANASTVPTHPGTNP